MIIVKVHSVGLNPVEAKDVIGDKIPHSCTSIRSLLKQKFIKSNIIGFEFSGIVISSSYTNNNINSSSINNKNVNKITDNDDYVFGTVPPFHRTLAEYIIVPIDQILSHMPLYYYNNENNENNNDNIDNNDNNDIITSSTSPNTDTTTSTTTISHKNNDIINTLQRCPLQFHQAACMPLV